MFIAQDKASRQMYSYRLLVVIAVTSFASRKVKVFNFTSKLFRPRASFLGIALDSVKQQVCDFSPQSML